MTELRTLVAHLNREIEQLESIQPHQDKTAQARRAARIARLDIVRGFLVEIDNVTNPWTTTDEVLERLRGMA